MDKARLPPVALTNLRTSQGFLHKLLGICERIVSEPPPPAPGTGDGPDQQIVQAITLLTNMTDAVLMQIEHCQRYGGTFSASKVMTAVLGAPTELPPHEKDGAEIQRMRVIMELCLQQGDVYRRRAFYQSAELNQMRSTVKDAYTELTAARSILEK